MSERKPFTMRERRAACDAFGSRERNNWNSGDLPAPYADGDVLYLPHKPEHSRLERDGMGEPGHYMVVSGYSVDEGDAWYFRVSDGVKVGDGWRRCSDRLHVVGPGGADKGWDLPCDYMADFELVETSDPEGLAERQRLLAEGWRYEAPPRCGECGQRLPRRLA